MKYSVKNSTPISVVAWIGSVYLSRKKLRNLSMWDLHLFPVPTKVNRISRASLGSYLLSTKSLTNEPPICPSFSTSFSWLEVCGSTSNDFLEFNNIGVDTNRWYQIWIGQNGTTIIRSALSCFIFENIFRYNWNRRECIKL